jgi:hypothetical protein
MNNAELIAQLEGLVGKVVMHKGASGADAEKRYGVAGLEPKKDFGSRLGVGPAVTIVRIPHGVATVRPGAKFLDEYELAPDAAAA